MDYRKLNSVSNMDAYPMPRIEELLDNLGEAKFISTLDLSRGYWQVPVEPEAQAKTAFTTPLVCFSFGGCHLAYKVLQPRSSGWSTNSWMVCSIVQMLTWMTL